MRTVALGRALRACAVEHDWDQTPPEVEAVVAAGGFDRLVHAAVDHGIGNLLYLAVRGLDAVAGHPLVDDLAGLHRQTMTHHLRSMADLRTLGAALDGAGIPWAVFKGPVLAERAYSRIDLRRYLDIDVLVPAHARAEAEAAVVAAGGRSIDAAPEDEGGQSHFEIGLGTVLDLHWDLVNRPEMREAVSVDSAAALDRRRSVPLSDGPLPTFDAADTVVHLAVHAALSGGVRLLWLKDVERAALDPELSWSTLVQRAEAWRVAAPVGVVLDRARRVLHAAVPAEVVAELAPTPLDRAVPAILDRIWPPETCGPRTPTFLWTRFRRDSAGRTVALMARRAKWATSRRMTDRHAG